MPNASRYLYFGPPAAAQDRDLSSYFIHTEAYKTIADFSDPRSVVVGKKGCGKSALFTVLAKTRGKNRLVICISPDTHQIPEIRAGYSYRQYSNLFQHEILLEILKEFWQNKSAHEPFSTAFVAGAATEAHQYVKVLQHIRGKLTGIKQVSVFGTGVSTDESKETVVRLASAQNSAKLKERVCAILDKGVDILVLIDDPDLLFGDVAHLVDVVGGLLLAGVNVTSMSGENDVGKIKVCTFVKQHKYELMALEFEDFDHVSQNMFPLSWKNEELDKLIAERVRFRENLPRGADTLQCWAKAFDIRDENELDSLRAYLYQRLRNGPRDLIYFCNLAKQTTNKRISKESLMDLEGDYSEDCLKQVEREYRDRYPGIVAVVQKLFNHPKLRTSGQIQRKLLVDSLGERYRDEGLRGLKKEHRWLNETTGRNLVDILFKVGIIGFMSKQKPSRAVMSYSSSPKDDSIHSATLFFVHQAYHRALGM